MESKQGIVLDLSKKFALDLTKKGVVDIPILRTKLAVDDSGSMGNLYSNGFVSNLIDLFIGAALKFDDNGELEMGFFDTKFVETEVATPDDAGEYLYKKARRRYLGGGTAFEPALYWLNPEKKPSSIIRSIFGAKPAPVLGQYLGFVTDGDNSDKEATRRILGKLEAEDVFVQIIGLGNGVKESYLNGLARTFQNVAYFHIPDPSKLTTDDFYDRLTNETLVSWINRRNPK